MEAGESPTEWLNAREASRWLGLPVRTLYQLIDDGELPAYRSGSDIVLCRADVDAYGGGRSASEDPSASSP